MKPVYIIAEAGINHNGDPSLAREMIRAARQAGADAVKFQTFIAEEVLTVATPKAPYQRRTTDPGESMLCLAKRLELTFDDFTELAAECSRVDIDFLSTPFDLASLDFLVRLGVDTIKIPSGEITNLPYLRRVGTTGKRLLLSTGMATLGEVEAALAILEKAGTPRTDITLLHCCTAYPAAIAEANLNAIRTMRTAFQTDVGFSDHTPGIEAAIAAVALGATVIEKHFTLDKTMEGPDHAASLDCDELAALVRAIRNIEQALGDGIKRPMPGEMVNMAAARRSIVAARDITAGELLSPDNLTVKRPGTGVCPMRWDEVIGRPAPKNFAKDSLIEL